MKKKLLNILQYAIFLGLGIFLLWYSASSLNEEQREKLRTTMLEADYWLAIPAMIMLLASHYSRALRWKILMQPLGYSPTNANTFFAVMAGYFFNLLVPRLGEVMKCTILARYEHVPVNKMIGTMVAERAFDLICLILVIIITFAIQFDRVGAYARREFGGLLYHPDGSLKFEKVLIVLGVIAVAILLLRFIFRRYSKVGFVSKLRSILRGIVEGITSVRYLKNKKAFFLHTLFIWTMYLLSIRVGFYAMEPVKHLGFEASFAILSFGSLAMIATQGGIGAYQLAIQKLMPIYGVNEGDGLGFGWLLWSVQTAIVIVVGMICLLLLPIVNRNSHAKRGTHRPENIPT